MLDYCARRPVITLRGIAWLLFGILIVTAVVWSYGDALDMVQRQEDQLELLSEQLKRKVRAREQRVADAKRLDPELASAKAVLRRLALPWEDVFMALEQATRAHHDRIRVLGVQPDVDKGVVMISGESKDFDVLIDYLERIKTSGVFTRVRLVNHQIQVNVAGHPIRFYAVGEWKPAS
jgi:hypothetical protein